MIWLKMTLDEFEDFLLTTNPKIEVTQHVMNITNNMVDGYIIARFQFGETNWIDKTVWFVHDTIDGTTVYSVECAAEEWEINGFEITDNDGEDFDRWDERPELIMITHLNDAANMEYRPGVNDDI